MDHTKKQIKIAFLTSTDPRDKRSWSGLHYYMAKALQLHCGEVHLLGPVLIDQNNTRSEFSIEQEKITGKKYNYFHSIIPSKRYAQVFEQKLKEQSFDLIFAPAVCTELAFVNTEIPIIYLSDATFNLVYNYYPEFSNLLNTCKYEGNIVEALSIKKSKVLLYPTEWAANSAIKDYGADKNKIHIIPFGANFDIVPKKELVQNKRKSDKCRLLFVGVNWERKGGEIAFETLLHLEKLGLKTELIVCGCIPPKEFYHKNMIVIPFLNKNNQKELENLYNLFYSSDFFILPSRAECMGEVFVEATAFGLPSIATDTGGISGVVKNNETGFTLPIEARGDEYAKLIYRIYQDDSIYYSLRKSSRAAFEERFNWDAWGSKVKEIINEII